MNDYSDFNKLVSMANKRYRRLEKKGWKTGAYKKAKQTGGQFHNKRGASKKEKAREYQRVKNFLNSKTSTVRGSRKVVKGMLSNTGLKDVVGGDADKVLKKGSHISTKKINKYFDIASKVDEYLSQSRGVNVSSDEIFRSVHDTYLSGNSPDLSNASSDEITAKAVQRIQKNYLKSHNSNSSRQTWSTI